jgi:hypothetical protein
VSTNFTTFVTDFEKVRLSLVDLGAKRMIHRAHVKELQDREINDGTGIVHRWMQENYADSMLIGLRRILDNARGSFSLVRLLRRVERSHALLNIDGYVQLSAGQPGRVDDWYVRALFAKFSNDGRTLDRQRIRVDIETLLASCERVLNYINTAVAHQTACESDATAPDTIITWGDLDTLFDEVTQLFNKYYGLVRPGVHVDFEPVLPAGFTRAFTRMIDRPANMRMEPTRRGS